jgi:hypothetical protein
MRICTPTNEKGTIFETIWGRKKDRVAQGPYWSENVFDVRCKIARKYWQDRGRRKNEGGTKFTSVRVQEADILE